MRALVQVMRTTFGGVEAYLKEYTSLTDADLARIRENLLEANA